MDLHHQNCPLTDALMNTVDALVVVADPDGRILQFNKACESTTGFSSRDVIGRRVVDALIPVDQRADVGRVIDDLAMPGTNRFENDWLTADGHRRRIAWSNATMLDADGDVTAIIGTGIDITEQRLLESRLAQEDRLESVGRLGAGIAHDFNNSLTGLVLRVDRLAARDLDPDSQIDIAAISSMIDRTQTLINELLSFSSPRRAEPGQIDVNAHVVRVLDLLDGLLTADVDVQLELVADPATASIDAIGFEQALTNLIINARDAMPDGGRLQIATTTEEIEADDAPSVRNPAGLGPGTYVKLSVADTGHGIRRDDLTRVLDPYFTTKAAGRGTGLGLATTYATLRQHGGAISVTSEPGRGATFEVWLSTEPAVVVAGFRVPNPIAPAHGRPHLALLVDDDDEIRRTLAQEFERRGCTTVTAASGEEALGHLDDPIDLLLTDVHLPGIGGQEVARRFSEHRPNLTVVYATGAPELEMLPADATVVRKPFTITQLVETIRDHLRASSGDPATTDVPRRG